MYNEQLASSSLSGGVGKYKGVTTLKQALSPNRMKNFFKPPKLRFPTEFALVANTPEIREAINDKFSLEIHNVGVIPFRHPSTYGVNNSKKYYRIKMK